MHASAHRRQLQLRPWCASCSDLALHIASAMLHLSERLQFKRVLDAAMLAVLTLLKDSIKPAHSGAKIQPV